MRKTLITADFKTFTSHGYYLRSILVADGLESTFHSRSTFFRKVEQKSLSYIDVQSFSVPKLS